MSKQIFRTIFIVFTTLLFAGCTTMPVTQVVSPTEAEEILPSPTTEIQPTSAPEETEAVEPPTETAVELGMAEILEALDGYPCSDTSDFTCVNISLPIDYFNLDSEETTVVVFGVLPATGTSQGMFVTVVGGPGGSGLQSADYYTWAFDESITENFDIVFFDQRGVSASGNIQCPQAAADFYRADWRTSTPEEEANLLKVAKTFSTDCIKEMGDTRLLPYLGTDQAVRDLESFRQEIQNQGSVTAEKMWIYGESYGTQFVQTYAAAFPEHVAAMILDGTVDLTVSGQVYYREQAQAFYDTLQSTLAACNEDELCAKDVGGDAFAAYQKITDMVSTSPVVFNFPLPSGEIEAREFTLADLETAVTGYLYSESPRTIMLRALASAATQDDLSPMARVLYDSLYIDPTTLEAIPDPSYSDAVYYGVECHDYYYPGETPEEAGEAYIQAGNEVDETLPYFESLYYGDIPCPYWPERTTNPDRPEPLTAEGIPTLVLGATADPATPYNQGVQVYERLADGYLVTMEGGAHIIFGRGDACVDDLVTDFLVNGTVPEEQETVCEGVMYDPYMPIPLMDAQDYADPLEAMVSMDNNINYLPEFYDWDWETPTSVGCTYGGVFSFEISDEGVDFTFTGCAFSDGFIMDGTGAYIDESGDFTMEIEVSGIAEGNLSYTHLYDGAASVTGEYGGETINLSQE
ncbi:MAG: alpha/beta fold hydrolase [Anaerolineales bacterium]|nr:alpha/beta fold hydrolase [Anaerolineales bacterium]